MGTVSPLGHSAQRQSLACVIDRKRGFLLGGKRRRDHNSEVICLGLLSMNKILRSKWTPLWIPRNPLVPYGPGGFFLRCALMPPLLLYFCLQLEIGL